MTMLTASYVDFALSIRPPSLQKLLDRGYGVPGVVCVLRPFES